MRIFFTYCMGLLFVFMSCKKGKETGKISTPVPFLTGKKWTSDTITVNPPAVYSQLNAIDKGKYRDALAWFKNAQITFNENGSVTCGGDYDFGYTYWKLVNNGADIEVQFFSIPKDTLHQWSADNQRFSYNLPYNSSLSFRYFFK
jgi:hypothetical protein